MTSAMTPRLILLCGLPGAGKTTLARRLEVEERAVRLCPDEWIERLGLDLRDEALRDRLEAQLGLLAQNLLRLGQRVILESGFWLRSDRDEKRLAARQIGAAVELRYLDIPLDELCRRVERRNAEGRWSAAPITRAEMEQWAAGFQAPTADELALFDPPRIR